MSDEIRYKWLRVDPDEWLADPALASCTAATRGIYLSLKCLLIKSKKQGYLFIGDSIPDHRTIKDVLRTHHRTLNKALKELLKHGKLKQDEDGVYYDPQLIASIETWKKQVAGGKKGADLRYGAQTHRSEDVEPIGQPIGEPRGVPSATRRLRSNIRKGEETEKNDPRGIIQSPAPATEPPAVSKAVSPNNSNRALPGTGKIRRIKRRDPILDDAELKRRFKELQEQYAFPDEEQTKICELLKWYLPVVLEEATAALQDKIDSNDPPRNRAAYFTQCVRYMLPRPPKKAAKLIKTKIDDYPVGIVADPTKGEKNV